MMILAQKWGYCSEVSMEVRELSIPTTIGIKFGRDTLGFLDTSAMYEYIIDQKDLFKTYSAPTMVTRTILTSASW